MLAVRAKIAPGASANVDLRRQEIIIQLLAESALSDEVVALRVKSFIQAGILAGGVLKELSYLFQVRWQAIWLTLSKGWPYGMPANLDEHNCKMVLTIPSASTDTPPSRFTQEFERLELLGRGAFGEVWRARSRVDLREYAVKVVKYKFNANSSHLDHPAVREAQTWAAVDHPSVVRYHAAWVELDGGTHPAHIQCNALKEPHGSADTSNCHNDANFSNKSLASCEADDSNGGVVFEAGDGSDLFDPTPSNKLPVRDGMDQIQPHQTGAPKATLKCSATLYVQTELIRGGTLREWIDRRNLALAPRAAACEENWVKQSEDIFSQLVSAVAHLHKQGLVHRDIKPANILISDDGRACLGDFGLAKEICVTTRRAIDDVVAASCTAVQRDIGEFGCQTLGVGTPTYASPEQVNGCRYGMEVDIYALGVILTELIFPVQTDHERAELLEKLQKRMLPSLSDALHQEAGGLALSMTSVDPVDRPSAEELMKCLLERNSTTSLVQVRRPEHTENTLRTVKSCSELNNTTKTSRFVRGCSEQLRVAPAHGQLGHAFAGGFGFW